MRMTTQFIRLTLPITVFALALAAPAAGQSGGDILAGNGTIYMGAFPNRILVIDEATERVVDEIDVPAGAPRSMTLSDDRSRFYMLDPMFEHLSTVDIARRETIDSFTLSKDNRRARIRSFRVDPAGRYAILNVDPAVKLIDRFEIEPRQLLQYDLVGHEVIKEVPWPTGEETLRSRMLFSPDGEYLYYFDEDVLILETENFTEVDRWALSQPLEDGLGRMNLGFAPDLVNEEPGFFTSLVRVRDDVQNRSLMGVARIDLPNRDVDFYTLGPSVDLRFALAPGRRTAYGVASEIGAYEILDVRSGEQAAGPAAGVRGPPANGTPRQHERPRAVHLTSRQYHRPLRSRLVRLPSDHGARRRHDLRHHRVAPRAVASNRDRHARPAVPPGPGLRGAVLAASGHRAVLASLTVGDATLRRYGAVSYTKNGAPAPQYQPK